MRVTTVYQSIENRDNADEVESHGPYSAIPSEAWLGEGYYFWESFIDNAHWWGRSHYRGEYMICEAKCDFDDSKCFDLVGNTQHMQEYLQVVETLQQQGLKTHTTTVTRVIQYLRKHNMFTYEACRVTSPQSRRINSQYNKPVQIGPHSKTYTVHLQPPIQICFCSVRSLNLRNYKVVYPEYYRDGYGV